MAQQVEPIPTTYASSYSSDSEDSESGDEFLASSTTPSTHGGAVMNKAVSEEEREAIIRRKLLESFYSVGSGGVGANTVHPSANGNIGTPLKSERDYSDDYDIRTKKEEGRQDLDSEEFDAHHNTHSLLLTSTVEKLLSVDEKLALDIRTLNSTMQTLVYENYSKFIDATDAVRSIGKSVDSCTDGLSNLIRGMDRISKISTEVDTALSRHRGAVAEKSRVRNHLKRLDALLRLPETLRLLIRGKKYRLAAKSHANAGVILAEHSGGFESLARIEGVCKEIMKDMVRDLRRKMMLWGGRDDDVGGFEKSYEEEDDKGVDMLGPPENVAEILECAGTLFMLANSKHYSLGMEGKDWDEDSFRSIALDSCLRLLLGDLDMHTHSQPTGQSLEHIIPTSFLDGILEAAILYGVTFPNQNYSSINGTHLLADFVSNSFNTFITHVRTSLLDLGVSHKNNNQGIGGDDDDDHFGQISSALTHLIRSVRELASGLALPEVGVDMGLASELVEQAVEVTELMIKRYVSLRFHALTEQVVTDCLAPFVKNSMMLPHQNGQQNNTLVDIVKMGSVALDNALQLLEDTISGISTILSKAPVEKTMVRLAVQKNARGFAYWLASAFEVLAGCDVISVGGGIKKEKEIMLQVAEEEDNDEEEESGKVRMRSMSLSGQEDVMSHLTDNDNSSTMSEDDPLFDIVIKIEEAHPKIKRHILLSLTKLCRSAETRTVQRISQSISSEMDHNIHQSNQATYDSAEELISKRFQVAASQILALYAMDQGTLAGNITCTDLRLTNQNEKPISGPRSLTLDTLQILKTMSLEYTQIFVNSENYPQNKLGPIPQFHDQDSYQPLSITSGIGGKKGLQLDVERMFAVRTPTYRSVSEFSRDAVVSRAFIIALKFLLEYCRKQTFSEGVHRQILVDVEFFRTFIPHYVLQENEAAPLINLLDDVVRSVEGRSLMVANGKDFREDPYGIVRRYLERDPDIFEGIVIRENIVTV